VARTLTDLGFDVDLRQELAHDAMVEAVAYGASRARVSLRVNDVPSLRFDILGFRLSRTGP